MTACRPVAEVNDHVRLLLNDMADTLKATPNCVALAANQIGVLRRLAVIVTESGVKKIVNPVILEESGLQECLEECVSFADIHGIMARPERVVMKALDENGSEFTLTAENDLAQVICHTIDHLDGKIFMNHVLRFVNMDENEEE